MTGTQQTEEPETSRSRGTGPLKVVIAGGGVAAMEAAIALTERAADLVRLTLLAPGEYLTFPPAAVLEPFGHPPSQGYLVARIAEALGCEVVRDRLAWVDRSARVVHSEGGRGLSYDALVICLGASARPRYRNAITVDGHDTKPLQVLIDDVRDERITRIAFIVPERSTWPLPLYELTLMSTARLADDHPELVITFITSERAPLDVFGAGSAARVAGLLRDRGVELVCEAACEVTAAGQVVIGPLQPRGHLDTPSSRRLETDRIVSLPELYGPHVRGLPTGGDGFIPVDRFCRVRGAQQVYAAGDATDFPVKHGGLAAQQADVAADSIAALAGAPVAPMPFRPMIQGMLLTGGEPWYLSARLTGGSHAFDSQLTGVPTWSPPSKVAARHLGPFLQRLSG